METSIHPHQTSDAREEAPVTDEHLASVAHTQLHIASGTSGLSPSASSILRVLLPSLTKLDTLLESVWDKQDALNEVLNRLATELDQFDELIVPPGVSPQALGSVASGGEKPPGSAGQLTAQRLRESRTKITNVNATLKKVRSRLDNISMLAQAKILQNQQQALPHHSLSPPKRAT
ncbi:hypothetical protein IWW57_004954 [Coemansia sp. S610]|nr:hypothetical protein IWW57_004954 [Coemansia sp. S610]KAJ2413637.1 hypothetical protein GGI10_002934 [Coemansia sp. RSA 2530]KAJ2700751.1 hypothetical protein H4218_001840 [Coemansia sp. IMI 209128]